MAEGTGTVKPDTRGSILLYDGLCNFCDATVQFILARDRNGSMQFAPLQGAYARELMSRHPALESVDSLMLVEPGASAAQERVLIRSSAAIAIGRYLGGGWRLLGALAGLLPHPVRDWGYDALARRRISLFGRREACRLPSGRDRERFLD